MSKVIRKKHHGSPREANFSTSQKRSYFHFVLHRGLRAKLFNPYSYFKSPKSWCSGTFIRSQKSIRLVGFTASFALLIFTALFISPIVIKTNVAEGTMGTAKASTSTITISSGESADLNVSTVSSTGTFTAAADEDMATFTVATDNFTGYTLNITGSDDNGLLTNTEASVSINSLAAATDAGTFANGSADTYNNKWGYQANILNTSTSQYAPLMSGNYLPAPTTTATAINTTACANGSTSCPNSVDTYGIRLGARLDYTKPTGTYTNTFILTAVANDVAYTISYEDNTGDSSVTGSPINPAATTAGSVAGGTASSATLSSSTPTRTGYTFRAWCLGTATHTAGVNSTCSGTEYNAGASFGIDQTIDNTDITLYALWNVDNYNVTVNFAGSGVSSVVFTAAGQTTRTVSTTGGTASLAYGVQYTVTMNFSSSSYTFDSWALNNSSYGTMTSSTTNPMYFVPNTQSSLAVITATGKSSATYMQDFTKSMCQSQASSSAVPVTDTRDNNTYNVRYINGNCWMVQNLRYVGDTGSTSTTMKMKAATSNISSDQDLAYTDLTTTPYNDYNNAKIHNSNNTTNGVWYNYAAASAGYVTSNQHSTVESAESVCPKNWRLPTNSEMSGIKSYQSAFFNGGSAVTGGYYNGGSVYSTGNGYWWSSTPYSSDSDYRYYLFYGGSGLGTSYLSRDYGFYVRCVRDADTMQSVTADTISSMSDGDTVELKDARDNNIYTTRKINGKLWMVQNLRYKGDTGSTSTTMKMKAATSNISSDQDLAYTDLTTYPYNDYNNAKIHNSNNTTKGVWYNYAAASAGYVTSTENSTVESTESVCPKNWRLPTNSEMSGITSYKDAFFNGGSAVTGGYYYGGSVASPGYGYWWSSTPYSSNSNYRYFLDCNGSSLGTSNNDRRDGFYVRCVYN